MLYNSFYFLLFIIIFFSLCFLLGTPGVKRRKASQHGLRSRQFHGLSKAGIPTDVYLLRVREVGSQTPKKGGPGGGGPGGSKMAKNGQKWQKWPKMAFLGGTPKNP